MESSRDSDQKRKESPCVEMSRDNDLKKAHKGSSL